MKFHVAADNPELRRAYALAAELNADSRPLSGSRPFSGEDVGTGFTRTFEGF
jgi:hypothetical protein